MDFPEGSLWRSRVDGSEWLKLSAPPLQGEDANWSPDGKRIAFMGMLPGKTFTAYVVPAAGGPPEPVLENQHNQARPVWSPDRKSMIISYIHWLEAKPQGITLVHLKSHKIERLPGSETLWDAEWSPDGRYIAARTFDSHAVMLFDFDTRRWLELAKSDVGHVRW